jgi:hypothetical protein
VKPSLTALFVGAAVPDGGTMTAALFTAWRLGVGRVKNDALIKARHHKAERIDVELDSIHVRVFAPSIWHAMYWAGHCDVVVLCVRGTKTRASADLETLRVARFFGAKHALLHVCHELSATDYDGGECMGRAVLGDAGYPPDDVPVSHTVEALARQLEEIALPPRDPDAPLRALVPHATGGRLVVHVVKGTLSNSFVSLIGNERPSRVRQMLHDGVVVEAARAGDWVEVILDEGVPSWLRGQPFGRGAIMVPNESLIATSNVPISAEIFEKATIKRRPLKADELTDGAGVDLHLGGLRRRGVLSFTKKPRAWREGERDDVIVRLKRPIADHAGEPCIVTWGSTIMSPRMVLRGAGRAFGSVL